MRGRIDLGGSSYVQSMEEKTGDYKLNIRKAQRTNQENDGKASKLEAEYYFSALKKCEEIMAMNLTQREIHSLWAARRKACEDRIREISEELTPRKPAPPQMPTPQSASKPTPQSASKPAPQPEGKRVTDADNTEEGEFKTKNANPDVSAETIRSWYQRDLEHLRGFEDLVGMEELKRRLMDEAASIGWDRIDKDLQISPVQSYFLYGPPGTGKTTFINAFAKEMKEQGFQYIKLTGSQIHNSLVGVAEKTVTAAFDEAIDAAPCVIFIDEVEGVCANRSDSNTASHEKRLTNAFLEARNKMKNCGKRIIFFGATNHPSDVDPAMLDSVKLLYLPLPDEKARESYFQFVFRNIPPEDGFSFGEMAAQTDNCSYRELDMLVNAVKSSIKQQMIRDYKVLDEAGEVDQEKTDEAAHEALSSGQVKLSRELYEMKLREYPPKDKSGVFESLKAFDNSLAGMG
ncbi:MAG: AAA family ATPase [Oscillospiraceae bacterium]|nr:AAA family ATPase [Oscillospiraceae bacterium]